MEWPFRRGIKDIRAEAWRVGELAVCVSDAWIDPGPNPPMVGDVLRVIAVEDHSCRKHRVRSYFLGFQGRPGTRYIARGFRKAVADDQAGEAEFATLIRRGKRTLSREPVA
jgi:hypothetical protein